MGSLKIFLGLFLLFVGIVHVQSHPDIPDATTTPKCNDTPKSNTGKLKKALFCGYDSSVRPVPHHSNQTVVKMSLFPLVVSWITEERNTAWITFWLYLEWQDNLLTWNVSDYEGLQGFHTEAGKIWVPDIVVIDPPQQQVVSRQMSCSVSNKGSVECMTTTSVIVNCNMDLSHYPYDDHFCKVVFQPRSYKGSEIDIDFLKDEMKDPFLYYRSHGMWALTEPKHNRTVTTLKDDMHICNLDFSFVLVRKSSTFTVILSSPVLVTMMMVLSLFWIEIQSSARIILAGLAVVSQVALVKLVMAGIASNFEQPPMIILFYRNSLVMTGIALVWTVAARSLCSSAFFPHSFHNMTSNLNKIPIVRFLLPQDIFLKSGATGDEDESSLVVHRDCVEQQWRVITILTDRIMFGAFSLSYMYFYLLLMP